MIDRKIDYFSFSTQSGNHYKNLRIHILHTFQPLFLKSFPCGHREDRVIHKGNGSQSLINILGMLGYVDI